MWGTPGRPRTIHHIDVDDKDYSLMLMCIYSMISDIEKKLERILDKRDSLGYIKRINELRKLKETIIAGKEGNDNVADNG